MCSNTLTIQYTYKYKVRGGGGDKYPQKKKTFSLEIYYRQCNDCFYIVNYKNWTKKVSAFCQIIKFSFYL